MKTCRTITCAVVAGILVVTGCANNRHVDTSSLEANFQVADVPIQDSAMKAVAALRSADHAAAFAELKKLFRNVRLTPEQRGAVRSVMAELEKNFGKSLVAPEAPPVSQGPLIVKAKG